MADWNENLPEWNDAGTEPPQSKKDEGWQAEEKPPAGWFNWLLNRTYKALQELQGNAEHTSNKGEVDGYASLDGTGNVPETQLGNVDGMEIHDNAYHDPDFETKADADAHKAKEATEQELGHVKVGDNLTIEEDGTLNAEEGYPQSNFNASTEPTESDDETKGYEAGSVWLDTTTDDEKGYLCLDATESNALWMPTTMPLAIYKILYHTEDEIDNLVQSESDMETVWGSVKAINEIIDTEMIMDKVTDSEIAMDKVTDGEIAMEKVMSKVMSRDKFYGAVGWVDKGIFNRSNWAEETILTENDWKQNKTFDQITDDENLMDEFADSEQSMNDSTDSEIAMDKVTDSQIAMDKVMADVMPRAKMLLSPHIIDTMWSKEMASETFWGEFTPEIPHTFGDGDDVVIESSLVKNDLGGHDLQFNVDGTNDYFGHSIIIDLSNTSDFIVNTYSSADRPMTILIDNDVFWTSDSSHGETTRTLDVTGYQGEHTIKLAVGDAGYIHYTATHRYGKIKLEG